MVMIAVIQSALASLARSHHPKERPIRRAGLVQSPQHEFQGDLPDHHHITFAAKPCLRWTTGYDQAAWFQLRNELLLQNTIVS